MKRYLSYILETEFGSQTYYDYNIVLYVYGLKDSATIYGHTIDDDMVVIMSK